MNAHTPPGTPGTPPTGSGGPHRPSGPAGTGFFNWIRSLGISRGYDRWFAGVAGGIATRAGIDPLIVRGIFIVLAVLGGPGLLLYLAGWLLLPDQGGRIHLEEVFRGRAGAAAVIGTVAVGLGLLYTLGFNIFGFPGVGEWRPWGFFWLPDWLSVTLTVLMWIVVTAGLVFLASRIFLRHGRKVREEGASAPTGAAPSGTSPRESTPDGATSDGAFPGSTFLAGASTTGASTEGAARGSGTPDDQAPTVPLEERIEDWSRKAAEGAERFGTRAGEWGEQVGKQADEWSARYAERYDHRKLGPAHIIITLAFALLAGGAAALWAVMNDRTTMPAVLTTALLAATGVLGISIIIAGVRGRNSGGIGFLAFCGVVALTFTSIVPEGTHFQPFGVQHVTSDTASSLLIAGTSEIDLTDRGTESGTGAGSTTSAQEDQNVWTVFGNANVTVPSDAPYTVKVWVLAGNISGPDAQGTITSTSGPLISRTMMSDGPEPDADSRAGSQAGSQADAAQTVTIYMLGGNVRVREELSR